MRRTDETMILCLDVGNTDIYGGVCRGREVIADFRRANSVHAGADEFGIFLSQVLAHRGIAVGDIRAIAIASVVPGCNAMLQQASERYLGRRPLLLQAGVRTGLKIRTKYPTEVGADRIANAIAAVELFPKQDRIVVDMGTATTFCAITREDDYLGGVIAAGLGLSMRALADNTAKLPHVDLDWPDTVLGKTTVAGIQSGLFHGHLGLVREVARGFTLEAFGGRKPLLIGTGGHARFFKDRGIWDAYVPDLVLRGLCRAVELNPTADEPQ